MTSIRFCVIPKYECDDMQIEYFDTYEEAIKYAEDYDDIAIIIREGITWTEYVNRVKGVNYEKDKS